MTCHLTRKKSQSHNAHTPPAARQAESRKPQAASSFVTSAQATGVLSQSVWLPSNGEVALFEQSCSTSLVQKSLAGVFLDFCPPPPYNGPLASAQKSGQHEGRVSAAWRRVSCSFGHHHQHPIIHPSAPNGGRIGQPQANVSN